MVCCIYLPPHFLVSAHVVSDTLQLYLIADSGKSLRQARSDQSGKTLFNPVGLLVRYHEPGFIVSSKFNITSTCKFSVKQLNCICVFQNTSNMCYQLI